MLFETYVSLTDKFPASCSSLYGEELPGGVGIWLAVDQDFYPSLLFSVKESDRRNDIELRFIGVQFSRFCEFTTDEMGYTSGTYTIVRLDENDPDLVRAFLSLLEDTFCDKAIRPHTNREIGEKILELANLFSQIEHSTKDIVGLWGELFIISRAERPESAACCWCLDSKAKYDFVCDEFALEVKTTVKPSRVHRFSLEQLRPKGEGAVYIASIQVVHSHGGSTVTELMEQILAALTDNKLRQAFRSLCLLKGGASIHKNGLKLQQLTTDTGIAYYDASEVPAPLVSEDSPISGVRFDVCFDKLKKLDREMQIRLTHLKPRISK